VRIEMVFLCSSLFSKRHNKLLSGSWFTKNRLKVIGWFLAALDITAQTIILLWNDITFPGFINSNNSLTNWIVWAIKISYKL